MIKAINLSPLRRSCCVKVNNLLFEAKMRDIRFTKYKDFALPFLLILLSTESSVLADDVLESNLIQEDKSLITTLESYSLPIIYSAFEMLKFRPHIINYIKALYANSKLPGK